MAKVYTPAKDIGEINSRIGRAKNQSDRAYWQEELRKLHNEKNEGGPIEDVPARIFIKD